MRRFGRSIASTIVWLGLAAHLAAQEVAPPWRLAAAGRAFAQYMQSTTARGARAFGSANWFMLGLGRQSSRAALTFDVMGSAEPVTLGECGYPRLLTPGFLCFANVLEDRDHAHPLIMSLGARFEHSLGERTRARLHAGLVGEPAFGPAPYFHRPSAQFDPITPLTNDLLNPAHTSYGLVTVGLASARTNWEASLFNGGAHDRNSYDFDVAPLHSFAARASAQLSGTVSGQFSFANVQAATGMSAHGHGGGRMRAWSASVQRVAGDATLGSAALLAWAAHHMGGEITHSALLEGQLTRSGHTLFGRAELVGRVEQEVQFIYFADGSHQHFEIPRRYRVGELAAGYAHQFGSWRGVDLNLGARASLTPIPAYIRPRYASERGFAFAVFTRLAAAPRAAAQQHH